ncbi:MAG: cation:proton antiporter [Trueperaceae bacterium]
MDIYMLVLTIVGLAFLGAAWVPLLIYKAPVSFPFLYIAFGLALFSLPLGLFLPNPLESSFFTERFTEILVIISLTGAGLKLARPIGWRSWQVTWRLLLLAMPLTIAFTALFGWWVIGLAPASALLLGAVLAPTDPVLASDVQVGPPGDPKGGEARFTLTSEAGLNDGLAFPFTHLAIAAAAAGTSAGLSWIAEWALYELLFKVAVGAAAGIGIGFALSRLIFSLPPSANTARTSSRDSFVVVAVTLLTYGVTELLHGYGFLGVFLAALTIRQQERDHPYQEQLHDFTAGLERLLMTLMLILFGGLIAQGLLAGSSLTMFAVALAVVFVIRPLAGLLSLARLSILPVERKVISFFGIRGIGSLYYLSFALNRKDFAGHEALWQTVSLTLLLSIVVHGASASIAMAHLDSRAPANAD